jgi:hypothetical protein
MTESEIAEIIADHEEMISAALAEGLSEAEIMSKFGNPEHLADELAGEKGHVHVDIDETYTLWKSFEPTTSEHKIEVNLVSEDVDYFLSESDQILVYATHSKRLDRYILHYEDGLFQLKTEKTIGIGLFTPFRFGDVAFKIGFPKKLVITDFSHTSVNSDIHVIGVTSASFKVVTTNGDLHIDQSDLGNTTWNTVNGDIHVQTSQFQSLTSSQVSGDLHMENTKIAETIKIHSVSGDAKFSHSECKLLDLDSVSGDVNGTEFYPQQVSLKSVSGDITIHNQRKNAIEVLRSKSVSGDVHIQ